MNYDELASILRTGDSPAPENLLMLEGFLNTYAGELGIEEFETPGSTQA